MGQMIGMACKNCGHEWISSLGRGMIAAHYVCNKCGKVITIDAATKKPDTCRCGGRYVTYEIFCPECKSKNIKNTGVLGLWD